VALAAAAMCATAGSAKAAIAVVIPHEYTCLNDYFSAFAYDPTLSPNRFLTGSYGNGADVRWSDVLDDVPEPWQLQGATLYNVAQIEIFAKAGFAANRITYQFWGMNWCPLDGTFFLEAFSQLRAPTGSNLLDQEVQLAKHYPGFPDSVSFPPQYLTTMVRVSNVGGIWKLTDNYLLNTNGFPSTSGFVTAGVQAGHQATVYPVGYTSMVYAKVYTIVEVLNEHELLLDQDPCYDPSGVARHVGYLLSIQPHLTLGTIRQVIPYFAQNLTQWPMAHYKGGMSLDGRTLYLGDQRTDNLLAVDTQDRETFTIFVSTEELQAYVAAQAATGRRMASIVDHVYYSTLLDSDWNNKSVDTTVNFNSSEQYLAGNTSVMKITFDTAAAKLVLESDPGKAPPPTNYQSLHFWIHGGTTGGQTMDVSVINSNGVGSSVTLAPPVANTWTYVVLPMSQFSVTGDVFQIVFDNTAAGAQGSFYIENLNLVYTDPPPGAMGTFDPTKAEVAAAAQIDVDSKGRIWFSEGHTNDILWTTDGDTIHTFLTSNEIQAVSKSVANVQPGTGVGILALIVDKMGTVYWGDNVTRSIWKAPAVDPANNIINLATFAELKTTFGFSPRGFSSFSIRGTELLNNQFADGNFVYKVDIESNDYGDFDGDVDVDLADYGLFWGCLAGPGVSAPPVGCTTQMFSWADVDKDNDVDLADYRKFEMWFTGPL
jgi:hypothetical protein